LARRIVDIRCTHVASPSPPHEASRILQIVRNLWIYEAALASAYCTALGRCVAQQGEVLNMRNVSSAWVVVLTGGDGSRLREITRTAAGEVVPKQFCSLLRKTCLLEDAIRRAQAVASAQHICSVVAEQHRRWWRAAAGVLG
jgi:hypothetical protein